MVGPRGLTSFTAAASVARQAQAGEVGAVLHAGPSVQAGVGDTATCKAHAAVLRAELRDLLSAQQCQSLIPAVSHSSQVSELPPEATSSGAGEGLGCTMMLPEPSHTALPPLDVNSSTILARAGQTWGFGLPLEHRDESWMLSPSLGSLQCQPLAQSLCPGPTPPFPWRDAAIVFQEGSMQTVQR